METAVKATNATIKENNELHTDNTTTFLIGFGILLIFILLGILASAFLCITLKKDPFLWDAERERQLQEKEDENVDENSKERDKLDTEDVNLEAVDV